MPARVGAAIAAAAALVLVVLAVVLAGSDRRLAGTNTRVAASGVTLEVYPGRQICHRQDIPADTDALRVFAAPLWIGAGPVAITVTKGGEMVTGTRSPEVPAAGPLTLGLAAPVKTAVAQARVCIENRGATPFVVAGDRTPLLGGQANPASQELDDDPRVDFLRPESESWLAMASTIADRFGLQKASFFGSWTMWAVLALFALACAAALRLLWREVGQE